VGKPTDCVYPDVVPVVAFVVFLNLELRAAAETHFKTEWKTLTDYGKWLSVHPPDGDMTLTRISAVFLRYTKQQFNIY
jgi:hypothetical protein